MCHDFQFFVLDPECPEGSWVGMFFWTFKSSQNVSKCHTLPNRLRWKHESKLIQRPTFEGSELGFHQGHQSPGWVVVSDGAGRIGIFRSCKIPNWLRQKGWHLELPFVQINMFSELFLSPFRMKSQRDQVGTRTADGSVFRGQPASQRKGREFKDYQWISMVSPSPSSQAVSQGSQVPHIG